jgi:protein-disulfide isomerase/uncharacterized membrane protein
VLASLAGLAVALVLVRVHQQAHAGVSSFCDINETFSCDKVANSPYSVVLGLPVAAWGALAYGLGALLAGWGLTSRRLHAAWPAGLLLLLGAGAVAASVVLALVSKLLVGAWCLMCMASWVAALGLLASAWAAVRRIGARAGLRADLAALSARPRWTGVALLAGMALVAGLVAAAPRDWVGPRPPRPVGGPGDSGQPAPGLPLRDPAEGAVLFSDYECPFCAGAHAELKAMLAARPDIKVVKRHFPLDQSCNPMVKRPIHTEACGWARAAICADEQGRFEPMDDALYGNQRAKKPVEALAADLGLDVPRFQACLAAPSTERRLQDDIAAALKANVKATPTYLVGGGEYNGHLPVEIFRKPGTPGGGDQAVPGAPAGGAASATVPPARVP